MMEVVALVNLFIGGAQVQRGQRFNYPHGPEHAAKDAVQGLIQLLEDAGVAVQSGEPKPSAGVPKKSALIALCAEHGIEVKNPVGVKTVELIQLLEDAGVAVQSGE